MASGSVAWTVRSVAEPSQFSPNDATACGTEEKCARYQLAVLNSGDEVSSGVATLRDKLPKGLVPQGIESGANRNGTEIPKEEGGAEWACAVQEEAPEEWVATCSFAEAIPAGAYAPHLEILVSAPAETSGLLKNEVTVAEGGASLAGATTVRTPISLAPQPFEVTDFTMEAAEATGEPTVQAGGHPWQITTSISFPITASPPGVSAGEHIFAPVENLKKVTVELPLGLSGNPLATTEQCTETQLSSQACPDGSRVGTIAFAGALFVNGAFRFTGTETSYNSASAVYNMTPEAGYPAELAFVFASQDVYLYASVIHSAAGDHLRVITPAVPSVVGAAAVALTLWGDPGALNGTGVQTAFISAPSSCTGGSGKARVEAESWENPGHSVSRETTVFPPLAGCGLLAPVFNPSLDVHPGGTGSTTQADEPSAYAARLGVPQTSLFTELAAPEIKNLAVSLPAGVSLSASAAQGLVGCKATGPNGINLGTEQIAPDGHDEGNPEATELGAGHAGGNGSRYDDGAYHIARGHCPEASIVGSVEVVSPVIAAPLHGHVYLAEPRCGGASQPVCTEADATNGVLYSGYLEAEGSGVLIKERGTLSVDPVTGQVTLHASQLPQLPFSELKVKVNGGSRAPLANPQSCGSFTTMSSLEPWSAPFTPTATPSSAAFAVDWDGAGGACPASAPFAPGFAAGTTGPVAKAFSPFVLTLTRQDREQDPTKLSVTLPKGLLAKIAGIPLCGEAQANAGSCGAESEIGSASALAGAGEHPLSVSGGRVYLTGPYEGQPFGLSVVVPAVAGPFHLGDVVVRSAIHIDRRTAAVAIVSGSIPQSRDGVPFRLRAIHVEVDRSGFTLNPTSCTPKQVTGIASGSGGATANLSSPFGITGCKALPFKPKFTVSTQAKTHKATGESLRVKVSSSPQQANIGQVKTNLPLQLPSRLSTLNKACLAAVFDANPSSCPSASVVGTARVVTPILKSALSGPAYVVSHGGAAFPDLEIVLQGEGVTLVLDGITNIKKGITSSAFRALPDAPISTFELVLPKGPHSLLTGYGDLCAKPLNMPTAITGQNGVVVRQTTRIGVVGCPKKPKHHITAKRRG